MMLGKVKWPGIYICTAMGVWGVVSAAQTMVQDFTGLAIARFFIGFVEAVFFPGGLFYLSLFYNRKQYAFRAALFYSGSQLGNAFGGLLAIGILELDGKHELEGWRWVSRAASVRPNVLMTNQLTTRVLAFSRRRRSNYWSGNSVCSGFAEFPQRDEKLN